MVENLLCYFNGLKICLKIGQIGERGGKQGKFRSAESFSAELSTEAVDFFPLAPGPISLQPIQRIDVSRRLLSA
jgi:hypothetical protein